MFSLSRGGHGTKTNGRSDRSEDHGHSARRPEAGQHNVPRGDRQQSSGEDHRFRLGVPGATSGRHAKQEDPGGAVPRARGILPGRVGPRAGRVVAGSDHARNRHGRQTVWRDRRATLGPARDERVRRRF